MPLWSIDWSEPLELLALLIRSVRRRNENHVPLIALEFAKNGTIPEIPGAGGEPDSDFEISVGYILKQAGYEIVPQVGVSGFSIDIGVKDSANPGRYLAGIECDGAAYHSAKSARDRDRLRQEILESHGWKIYRIWSTDWFKNKRHEETRLLQFLSAARLEAARA
jgi:hypothetical protein